MKKIFILICTFFIAVNVSAQTRKVGDIIMVDGEFGVVFAVTTDGQHGKAMSVSETYCDWNNAKTWCANYGMGWKLPTKDELLVIRRNRAVIDSALKINGYTMLRDYYYWSSEISGEFCAWGVHMLGRDANYDLKSSGYYVRAVSAF